MPQPVIRPEDARQLVRDALVLQRDAHPDIVYATDLPDAAVVVPCDRRLLGQALVNLLQNAADAVTMRAQADSGEEPTGRPQPLVQGQVNGHITVRVAVTDEAGIVTVEDDGIGLPQGEERDRLTEPYVTHKAKGTGLGLAIVKKIMEDHGGTLTLEDRGETAAGGRLGARAVLRLPWRAAQDRGMTLEPQSDGAMSGTIDGSGLRRAHGA
jgi:two-component system nitrogen regulation sensor histidine kinase NtrY